MSLSAAVFGRDSAIFKVGNILHLGIPLWLDKQFAGPTQRIALGEISRQTAKEAEPRVIVWGRVRPIGGNLIQCQEPRRWWSKEKTGGKGGGGGSTQKVEHVSRTYAIGVCEGPITAYLRIWRNNKLVYDARGNEWGDENNPTFLSKFRLYTGSWAQMPDSTLESIWGVGQVPAYRGTAYMVARDEELTDLGGAVPQWQFEVARAEGLVLTSKPYPADTTDAIEINFQLIDGELRSILNSYSIPAESIDIDFDLVGGELRQALHTYSIPTEALDIDFDLVAGELRSVLHSYTDWPEEAIDIDFDLVAGELRVALIEYLNWPAEGVDITFSLVSGSMSNG